MWIRRIAIGLGVLVVLALLAGAGLWVAWRRSGLPQRSGEARIEGLSAAVTVRFDARGVPHVEGESLDDVCAALGWLHANDRMTHLELGRRASAGRLSELFGERTFETDMYMRMLRIRQTAESYYEACSPRSKGMLDAYARGVNAWLDARGEDLPPALRLLRADPEPWEPADSLGFALLMARDLSYLIRREETRFVWLAELGPERTRDLVGDPDMVVPDAIAALAADLGAKWAASRERAEPDAEPTEESGDSGGSNNWALAPSRTEGGHALVANDPHLGLRLPSVWYQATIECPEYHAAGMTIPGIPLVVIGQGPKLAWGFTNAEIDVNDLFFEQTSPDGRAVRRGDEWVPLYVEPARVDVGGGVSMEVETFVSDIGPYLPPNPRRGVPGRSLMWTAYGPFDPLEPFLGLAGCESVDEIPAATSGYISPLQNIVAADASGGLYYALFGRAPKRGAGDGRLPSPAWQAEYVWKGLLSASEQPRLQSPESGAIATANDDVGWSGYDGPLTGDYATPHRAARIREALAGRERWSIDALRAVQLDLVSNYAREVVQRLAAMPPYAAGSAAERARVALTGWGGEMSASGPSALFELFDHYLHRELFADDARAYAIAMPGYPARRPAMLRALAGTLDPEWIDDRETAAVEGIGDIAERALELAWEDGAARWGEDVAGWEWSAMHHLVLRHPLGEAPYVGSFFDRGPYPVPGSATTPCVFSGSMRDGAVEVTHGPSMRWIADAAEPNRSLASLPGGQSGHPFDEHYDDRIEPFLAGEMDPIAFDAAAALASARSTLRIVP